MENAEIQKRRLFESLLLDHHVRVRAFVRSLGVDSDWVDDIAQEAFLTAYRQWDSFDAGRDFGKWVRGIAANIVRNEIRKDARRKRILHTELTQRLIQRAQETDSPATSLSISAIRECISELANKSRQLIQGRYGDGLSGPELARQLQLSADNVRQSLVRIRRQLKRCIELRVQGASS